MPLSYRLLRATVGRLTEFGSFGSVYFDTCFVLAQRAARTIYYIAQRIVSL